MVQVQELTAFFEALHSTNDPIAAREMALGMKSVKEPEHRGAAISSDDIERLRREKTRRDSVTRDASDMRRETSSPIDRALSAARERESMLELDLSKLGVTKGGDE